MSSRPKRQRTPRRTPPGVKPIPRKLRPADLKRHRMLLGRLEPAQQVAQAGQLALVKAEGAIEAWMEELQERYKLPDGTGIQPDGVINPPDAGR